MFLAEKEQGGDRVLRARGQGDFVAGLKCAEAHRAIAPCWLSCLVGYMAENLILFDEMKRRVSMIEKVWKLQGQNKAFPGELGWEDAALWGTPHSPR